MPREQLEADGKPASWVARRLFEVLSPPGVVRLCDGMPHDQMWLETLMETADLPVVRLRDVRLAYARACEPLSEVVASDADYRRETQRIVAVAELGVEARPGRRHRAAADVAMLIATYDEIVRVVRARVHGP